MTQTDIEPGLLMMEVGVAPVYPAGFVFVRIGHKGLMGQRLAAPRANWTTV